MIRLKLVLALSLDGRLAPPAGGAAQLGGRGDRRALEQALAWADAVLLGAETLRLHGSTCLIRQADLLEQRRHQARSAQPLALVVSRSGRFDPALPFFSQPLTRWLLTPTKAPVPPGFERQLAFAVWGELLDQLEGLGLVRLVALGGAQLASSLLEDDRVDELHLTLCPLLLGGGHCWLPPQAEPSGRRWQLLEHRELGEGELLLRYCKADSGEAGDGDWG